MDALISPRRRQLLLGLGAAALATGCGRAPRVAGVHALHGATMGSTFTVKLAAPHLGGADLAEARAAVEGAFDAVVERMSLFDPRSELVQFNAHGSTSPFALSAETVAVFELAQRVSAQTQGAFDATVAPVVAAWGFGPAGRNAIPDHATRLAAQARVDWRGLALDGEQRTVAKRRPDLAVDFSGVAKGYAVDLAAGALDALGHDRYLVEAGGEVRTRGANGDGRPWQVAIERPDALPQRAHFVVPLAGLALATSGDYRIYFERDGARYCHEIDPASGAPIAHDLASVSVAAADCGYADAMATALIVLGPQHGYALALESGIAAFFVVREADGRLRDFATPAFAALGGYRYA